jgi:trk system potassium uptake protein
MAGRRVEQIALPRGVQIGAIVRGLPVPGEAALGEERAEEKSAAAPEVIIAHHDTLIRSGDRVIVFMPSKKQVREVEKLFQVAATFFG